MALFDNSGSVVERYIYDPYGTPSYLTGAWASRSASSYAWVHLHQGGRWESQSRLYHFRHRDLSPSLGRWLTLDPIGFDAGDVNLYRYVGNGPTGRIDPAGLEDKVGRPIPGKTPGYGTTEPEIGKVNDTLKCIDDAKPAVDAIIDRDLYGMNCPIEKIKAAVHRLMELASFYWDKPVGRIRGKCYEWVDTYARIVEPLLKQLNNDGLLGCCIRVGGMTAENAFFPSWKGEGHCFVRIEIFGTYGSQVIYIDDGNWGGDDHVFVYEEIPWWYGRGGWMEARTTYSEWGPIPKHPNCRRPAPHIW